MGNCRSCGKNDEIGEKKDTDCGIFVENPMYLGDCQLNDDGTVINDLPNNTDKSCEKIGDRILCPTDDNCYPWDITEGDDSCNIEDYITEQINISGAKLNVHKLLGVHEQGLLQDLIANGNPIASDTLPNFPASNAFDQYITEWRSEDTGENVIIKSFIGYDFGPIRLDNGRVRYGIETSVKHNITMLKIKQGCNTENRATEIRIERSEDGKKWFGVAKKSLPDCDSLVTITFNSTVPSRFWRIRPTKFNGTNTDPWIISALQLIDYEYTNEGNIQDKILLENRDRDYMSVPIKIKCSYTPIDVVMNESQWGVFQTDQYVLQVGFAQSVKSLGRPFIIGDIVQLPSETQYSRTMTPIKKYLEIVDVAWSTTGYTPEWTPVLQRLLATPVMASQETQQIFGKLTEDIDSSGLVDIDDGKSSMYQDISNVSGTIKANSNTDVPENGEDNADVAKLSDELIEYGKKKGFNLAPIDRGRSLYGVDGMPPNGELYTESDEFPETPKNGDYHRLTYTNIKNKDIAPRLYRYSSRRSHWVYIETDRRYESRKTKPKLQEFVDPDTSTRTSPDETKDKFQNS